ncbi:MAG TPA: alpha/beta hydrolase [Verrucomicrobiae bacterium]|nr:alpha/beta hydrolase [Verrucomicrobiae bacterium]
MDELVPQLLNSTMRGCARPVWLAIIILLLVTAHIEAQSSWKDKSPHDSKFVTVPGVRLHYPDWGGRGDTPHAFDDLARQFTNHFRALGLSRRGHGLSDAPESGYDTATRVEDIRHFLDALKIPRAVLAGHSTAGGEMTMLAGTSPDRVAKLIFLDAIYDPHRRLEIGRLSPPEMYPAKTDTESLENMRRWLQQMNNGWSEAWEATLRQNFSPDGKTFLKSEAHNRALSLMTAEGTEADQDYAAIKCPVLAITVVGFPTNMMNYFKTLPVERQNAMSEYLNFVNESKQKETDRFRQELPNARIVPLTNADHHCFIEREKEVVQHMRKFLTPPTHIP